MCVLNANFSDQKILLEQDDDGLCIIIESKMVVMEFLQERKTAGVHVCM